MTEWMEDVDLRGGGLVAGTHLVKGGHGAFSLAVLDLASRHGLVLYQSCRSHFFHDDGTSHVSMTLESFFW